MESGRPSQHRVIVLSDGHANEGIVDPASLALHAEQLALRDYSVHRSESATTTTVRRSKRSRYMAAALTTVLHRPHEIVEVVTAELQDIRLTTAENITVTIQHAPGVQLKCLNEFPLSHEDDRYVCNLGSLAAGASRTAVFSIKFPAGEVGTKCPFRVRTTWRRTGEEDVYGGEPCMLNAEFAEGKDNNAQPHDPSLTETVAQVWQAYIVRRIVRLNREGRYAEAIKRLDHDLPLFSKYAKNAASGPILTAELTRLREAASREWSEGSRKEVELAMYKRQL